MPQPKRASKGKLPGKAVSVLGIAGVSLAASAGGSPADIPSASLAAPTAGSVADILWQNTAPFQVPSLDEEEISDVSLATFYLFDNENLGNSRSGIQLAAVRGGCGCGHGCGGCRGCGGFRGCGHGCGGCAGRGCGRGCRGCGVGGCGWGGCGGCGCGGVIWGWGGGCCLSWGGCNLLC
jgi:hypothetical protein